MVAVAPSPLGQILEVRISLVIAFLGVQVPANKTVPFRTRAAAGLQDRPWLTPDMGGGVVRPRLRTPGPGLEHGPRTDHAREAVVWGCSAGGWG